MNNRKTVLSLSFITPANLWIGVNQGWNSRTQVTQLWQARGISVGWMGNLQCQHSRSTVLNTLSQYVSNFLSILMVIRSLEPEWNREKGLYSLGLNVATGHQECWLCPFPVSSSCLALKDTGHLWLQGLQATSWTCHLIRELPRVPS